MTKKFLLPLFVFAFSAVHAQVFEGPAAEARVKGAAVCRINPETRLPEFVRFRPESRPMESQLESWARENLHLTEGDEMRLLRSGTDATGMQHHRYQQYYYGMPVITGTFIAHSRNGRLEMVNGDWMPITQQPVPLITREAALQRALAHMGASRYQWEIPGADAELQRITRNPAASWQPVPELVYAPVNATFPHGEVKLAWKVDLYAAEPLARKEIYIDALTGEVNFVNEKLHTTDVVGIAHTRYSGVHEITTDSMPNGIFRLRESGRGSGIETLNALNGTAENNAVDFLDSNNVWQNFNAAEDEVATDAHWGAEMTYDYYSTVHNRLSWDDNDGLIVSYVHWDQNLSNAFWDGVGMHFGDGGGGSNPFSSLDVLGHEFTHGVTQEAAGLIYQNEPGALNESFSDIFGAAIEYWVSPADFNWIIGEDVVGGGIRNMENPNSFGNPSDYQGQYWFTGAGDNGGVHINSGVQNYWFVLLSDGGSGTNDNGEAYSVTGLGVPTAAQIAYHNLQFFLSPSSDYEDARFYSIQSAITLFGECSPEMISTMNAWHGCSLGSPFSATATSAFTAAEVEYCSAPAQVQFINQAQGALTWLWKFGDGSTSTVLNPVHTYSFYGTYDVTLISTGCGGVRDTLFMPDFINVSDTIVCRTTMPVNNRDSITACEGTLLDSGGNQDYENNSVSTVTISPPGATSVTLQFVSFDMETAGDYIRIYDGPTTSSPTIGLFNGNTLPGGGTITSTGGSITIKESTNPFGTRSGYEIDWTCEGFISADQPVAGYLAVYPNPATQRAVVEMKDISGEARLQVFNALGQPVLESAISGNRRETLLLNDWSPGIYLVVVQQKENRWFQRLVVE